MAQFEIRDLSFCYPGKQQKALDQISVSIEAGEYITVCGKSGSGKTTLLRHLKSVLTPHGKRKGTILFEGAPLEQSDLRRQSSRIGYVMQNPDSQIVTDKVWHELAFGLESLGTDQKTIRLRVAEMASYFGIQGWFHRNVTELSGGQKQLLNLASIMAMQPAVLILDEPTSQLDPIAASDFLNTVRKINLELGTTIIITEHRLEDIFHASDRVLVLENGRIVEDAPPRETAAFLRENGGEMFAAMPSPVQIFYGVNDTLDCPLTVREGRSWLSRLFEQWYGGQDTDIAEALPVRRLAEQPEIDDVNDPMVLVKEAWFRYEKDAPDVLKGVSFAVRKQELFAIVGGNGTGKSTMLKAICQICRPYRGHVYLAGKRIDKYRGTELFSHNLAMLPQDPQSLFVKKTVREELLEMVPSSAAEDKNRGERLQQDEELLPEAIREIAALCDIMHLMNSHPYDLSGGEQQRTALAKVLLTDPKVLLLDEPTKGMDNFFKQKFGGILGQLKEKGVTVIMVSHDVEFCARYADRVSMFFDGGIITTETPQRFFSQNSFYTTAANRMSRHLFENAVTNDDVIRLCRENMSEN